MADDILKFRAGDLREIVMEQAAERDVTVSQWLREAATAYADKPPCESCEHENCDICGSEVLALENLATDTAQATIIGYGRFDETSHPEVAALIERAKELLAVGAVGVSVALDLDPADLPANPDDVTEDDIANARVRNRHLAIVDTAAFSGAFLENFPDGSVSGPMVFEGQVTGDLRSVGPVGTINLEDESLLPIPILFDLHDGDHTGTVVGHIDRWERVDGIVGKEVAPIAASLSNADAYPSYLFSEPEPTAMTVHAPDSNGYRRYTGIIAPSGVCHKGQKGCYTYRGANLDYFHSGARVLLDDGTYTRVGPLMFGDLHADGSQMDYASALTRTNEDARTVCAMGRVFDHPKGALFSGVLMPDADVPRIQACAPSVELWPDHKGKLELKTALLVPRPAFPVAASLSGGGVQLTESEQTVVDEPHGEHHTNLEALAKRMDDLETSVGELLRAHYAAQFDVDERIDRLHGPGAAAALDAAIADGSIYND